MKEIVLMKKCIYINPALLLFSVGIFVLAACSPTGVKPIDVSVDSAGEDPPTNDPSADLALENPTKVASPSEGEMEGSPILAMTPTPTLIKRSEPTPLAEGEWMSFPVIPELSERALEIYTAGISGGNDPHAFSKVGDCQNVPSMFVSIFDHPGFYTLGQDYEYLTETIDWYQGSFERESEAVRRGFNAASVVSPVWADPEVCEIGEDPLQCELRLYKPSVAIVSLETWWAGDPDNYEKYVRQILETLIDGGVLPILATKADNLEGDHRINGVLAGLAHEYQIPLWNFWLAVQTLPDQGLMEDGFHLTFAPNEFDDPQVMKAAWPWRNLTALQVLDKVRETVQSSS